MRSRKRPRQCALGHRIPGPLKASLNWSLAALDGALSRGYGTDGRGQNLGVDEVDTFDQSFDELFEKVTAVVPCVPEKDSSFLGWRYGPGSPQYPVKVLVVREGRALLGYAVLKTLHTGEDGFIMDLSVLPGHREVARTLLRESVRYFRGAGVHIIRYRYLPSPTSPGPDDLRRLGFFHRKGSWMEDLDVAKAGFVNRRSRGYLMEMMRRTHDAGHGHFFFAFHEGTPLSGAFVLTFGEKLWFMHGASGHEKRKLQGNYLLQWEIIRWAKRRGITHCDFVGAPKPGDRNEDDPYYGVYRFKMGFGGDLAEYLGCMDLAVRPRLAAAWYGLEPLYYRAHYALKHDVFY